jgi:hypothetical protein
VQGGIVSAQRHFAYVVRLWVYIKLSAHCPSGTVRTQERMWFYNVVLGSIVVPRELCRSCGRHISSMCCDVGLCPLTSSHDCLAVYRRRFNSGCWSLQSECWSVGHSRVAVYGLWRIFVKLGSRVCPLKRTWVYGVFIFNTGGRRKLHHNGLRNLCSSPEYMRTLQ